MRWGTAILVWLGSASPALAHTSERGFILLLPTEYYLIGGTLSVAASLLFLALVPPGAVLRGFRGSIRLHWCRARPLDDSIAAISFLAFAGLIYCGVAGSRDPLTNPLPLTLWTLGWVGITVLHALIGNLWAVLNPWRFPVRLIRRLAGHPPVGDGPLPLPRWLRVWPAILLFMGIAWFELVDLAPDDPDRLAFWAGLYWMIGLLGCLAFGEAQWLRVGEPLSILFRYLSLLAPIHVEEDTDGRRRIALTWPGSRVMTEEAPGIPVALFILLTLATVSFDGLKMTFWWLGLNGINPLEFPGRSAVVGISTVGLIAAWITLTGAYVLAVLLGQRLGKGRDVGGAVGLFVLSILPISLAYHVSHYLTVFLVNGQWALVAFNDPRATGANLLGLKGMYVTTSFLNVSASVERIWQVQVAAIVIGHILAVILAHGLSARLNGDGSRRDAISHIPLGVLMILYTLFGLWLLASPTGG